jgi:hypothetical protein
VALFVVCEPLQKFEPLLASQVGSHTGMGLVYDDELGASASETLATLFGLYIVKADNGIRVRPKQRLRCRERSFKSGSRRRGDSNGIYVEFPAKFRRPLIDKLRRTKDRETLYLSTVDQLTQYEAGLNGLSNSHIIGNHQAHCGNAEGHEQRNQLIGARLESYTRGRAEWSCAAAQRKPQSLRQKAASILGCQIIQFRKIKPGRHDRFGLKRGVKQLNVRLATGQRPETKQAWVG